ncbi:MAG: hypothetical protein EBZ77_08255 [Chitinophagia bacterium]|nr:hypothetical protein [Chitinophagia bacterium]
MLTRQTVLLIALLLGTEYSIAQKKQFTITEATNGMATTLATKGLKGVNWQPGANAMWEVIRKDSTDLWKVTKVSSPGGKLDLTSHEVLPTSYPKSVSVTGLPAVKWTGKNTAYFINGNQVVFGNYSAAGFNWNTVTNLGNEADNITVDNSQKVAYTIDNNIWLATPGKEPVKVTAEPTNVICGKAVHRDEFGIDRGLFFSPKGNLLAYYRMDQRMVADYPVVLWNSVPAAPKIIKYPMAGDTSHEVTVCIFNHATNQTITLKTGDTHRDHYLTAVTWSPDEKHVYIAILNREQNHLWLNRYNAATGEKEATLFEETNSKYVHPTHSLYFVPGHDDQFIWWSERDGYQHLYLYHTNGKLIRQLTKGNWVVNELIGYRTATSDLVITTSKESPLEKHIYTLNIDNSKLEKIDEGIIWILKGSSLYLRQGKIMEYQKALQSTRLDRR